VLWLHLRNQTEQQRASNREGFLEDQVTSVILHSHRECQQAIHCFGHVLNRHCIYFASHGAHLTPLLCTLLLCPHAQVADGCSVLEDALALLQSAGTPPLAPDLAADIQDAVENFVVQRILDQLRGPMTQEAAPARRRAISMLRGLLSKGTSSTAAGSSSMPRMMLGGGFFASMAAASSTNGSGAANGDEAVPAGAAANAVTADYIRLVVDCLTSQELVGMANWEQVAKNAGTTSW
jgi:hypothetical protein